MTKHIPAHVTSLPQMTTPWHSWPHGAPSAARPLPPGPLECHGTSATFCSGHRPAAALPRGHEGGPGPEPWPSWQRGLCPTHAPGQPSGTLPAPPPCLGKSSPAPCVVVFVTCHHHHQLSHLHGFCHSGRSDANTVLPSSLLPAGPSEEAEGAEPPWGHRGPAEAVSPSGPLPSSGGGQTGGKVNAGRAGDGLGRTPARAGLGSGGGDT